jgi:hypothetical protein
MRSRRSTLPAARRRLGRNTVAGLRPRWAGGRIPCQPIIGRQRVCLDLGFVHFCRWSRRTFRGFRQRLATRPEVGRPKLIARRQAVTKMNAIGSRRNRLEHRRIDGERTRHVFGMENHFHPWKRLAGGRVNAQPSHRNRSAEVCHDGDDLLVQFGQRFSRNAKRVSRRGHVGAAVICTSLFSVKVQSAREP